jgi:hypothetical protein
LPLDERGLLWYKNHIIQCCARDDDVAGRFRFDGGLADAMPKPPATPRSTDRVRRDALILKAAAKGSSAQSIERALKAAGFKPISRARLVAIMKRGGAGASEMSADFRAKELARLAELQEALHAKALKGDNAAVDRVLAILDRRAKLLGVSAPPAAEGAESSQAKEVLLQKLDAMATRLSGDAAATPRAPEER